MDIINIHDAKTHLSKLIARAEAGEKITIARNGSPAVTLSKYRQPAQKPEKRIPGLMKGEIWLSDDWDSAEANEEIARTFYESMGIDYNDLPVLKDQDETSS